jgi:RNA polymerase sigma-70 factor, ECF subfamily
VNERPHGRAPGRICEEAREPAVEPSLTGRAGIDSPGRVEMDGSSLVQPEVAMAQPGSRVADASSDTELMLAIRHDDPSAMSALVRRYEGSLKGFANALVQSEDDAEDVVQETFTRLWERRGRWDDSEQRGTVRSFLYAVARNLALNRTRATRNRGRLAQGAGESQTSVTPLQQLDATELHDAFRAALESLPARRREVFILARYHDLSYREIGEELSISPQTVANHLSAALNDLRVHLRDYLNVDED